MRLLRAVLVLLCMGPCVGRAAIPEHPLGRVSDLAHTLKADEISRLDAKLARYEEGTTRRIAVAIVPSLEGSSIEDVSLRIAEKWRTGSKASNDGVLLVLAPNEHKMRIEVGYGLEGTLTDLASAHVLDEMRPILRDGRVADAIEAGIDGIENVVAPAAPTPEPAAPEPSVDDLPWHHGKAVPNDRLDPHVYDTIGVLTPEQLVDLEQTARTLERETGNLYIAAIFDHESKAATAVCADISVRFQTSTSKMVLICDFGPGAASVTPGTSLVSKLDTAATTRLLDERAFPFLTQQRIAAGLTQTMLGADTVLTGRAHPMSIVQEVTTQAPHEPTFTAAPWYLINVVTDLDRQRLQELPTPFRVALTLLLDVILALTFSFLLIPIGPLIWVFALRRVRLRIRAEQTRGSRVPGLAWKPVFAIFVPLVLTAMWTDEIEWALVLTFDFVVLAVLLLSPLIDKLTEGHIDGLGGGWGSGSSDSWSSSSSGWSSSSSSSSSSDSSSGGSFGGGGASGSW